MFRRPFRVIAATAVIAVMSAPVATVAHAASSKLATTKKTTAVELRRQAVLDLYARQKDLQYRYLTNRTSILLVPKEGSKFYSGAYLDSRLRDEAAIQKSGIYYDMTPAQYEALSLRIASLSTTTAVVRVCERVTSIARFKADNGPAPDELPVFVTDLEYTAVYSSKTKRWLIAKGLHLEPDEGRSKCAGT